MINPDASFQSSSYSKPHQRYQRLAEFLENGSFDNDFDIAFYDNINGSSDIVFFDRTQNKIL